LHDTYCRAVAVADDIVLVSASTGPFTKHAAVYLRAIDVDGPFVRCDKGLPDWFADNIDTFQLAAHGSVAAIATRGRLFVSDDYGASWHLLVGGLVVGNTVAAFWT